jgi:hypothetical protein
MRISIPIRSAALLRCLTFVGILFIAVSRVFSAVPWMSELLPAEPAPVTAEIRAPHEHPAPDTLFHSKSEEISDDDSHDFDSLSPAAENSLLWLGPGLYPAAGTAKPNHWTIQPDAPPPRLC